VPFFKASTGSMNFKKIDLDVVRGVRNYEYDITAKPVSVICPSCQSEVETTELKEELGMVKCKNCWK
jgi:hypothetical protein